MIHNDTLGRKYRTIPWLFGPWRVIVPLVRGILSAHYGHANFLGPVPRKPDGVACRHGCCKRLKPDGSSFVSKSFFWSFPELFATTNSVLILHGPVFMAVTWQMTCWLRHPEKPKRSSTFLFVDWKLSFHEWFSHVLSFNWKYIGGCVCVYKYTDARKCLYHFVDLFKWIPHDDRIRLGCIFKATFCWEIVDGRNPASLGMGKTWDRLPINL